MALAAPSNHDNNGHNGEKSQRDDTYRNHFATA